MADETLAALRPLMASHSPPLDALNLPSDAAIGVDTAQKWEHAFSKRQQKLNLDGNFGIRLENVLVVNKVRFWRQGLLIFPTYNMGTLSKEAYGLYHSRCREILAPYLNTSENEWLKKATELDATIFYRVSRTLE